MSKESIRPLQQSTACLGIAAVGLFCVALAVFSLLNPGFDLIDDYVSKLGAKGQPLAFGWNMIGFASVGLLFTLFGWAYGLVVQNRLVAILFASFGLGYALTGVPVDLADSASTISKVHTVAICLALGSWLLGLARLAGSALLGKGDKLIANIAAILLVMPMIGYVLRLWPMPMTHRMVFCVVFGWVVVTSFRLWTGVSPDYDCSSINRASK